MRGLYIFNCPPDKIEGRFVRLNLTFGSLNVTDD